MNSVKTAVFPVAGFGTRFLPATKAMPKELLPILEKPLIQYAAEEAISAGIETLIFITGRNKRAIEDHFDSNKELELILRAKGKNIEADMIKNIIPKNVECIFVRQSDQLGLGHAVYCAKKVVGHNPFAVILADDFLIHPDIGATAEMISAFMKTSRMQLLAKRIDGPEISKYGVISVGNEDQNSVAGLVEKPEFKKASSNLASIGRYILTEEIFEQIEKLEAGYGGEIQLADAINSVASNGNAEFVELRGEHFDCGSVEGFLKAINRVSEIKNINL